MLETRLVKEVYLAKINSEQETLSDAAFIIRFTGMEALTKGDLTEKINSRGEWHTIGPKWVIVEQTLTYKKGQQNGPFERYYTQNSKNSSCIRAHTVTISLQGRVIFYYENWRTDWRKVSYANECA